jgi:hypothetical protein
MNDIVAIVAFVALILAIVGGVSIYAARMQRLRREGLQQLADQLGLSFAAEDPGSFRATLGEFQFSREGRAQRLYNLVRAEAEGVSLSAFDYQFTTGSGKSQHVHRQSMMLVESAALHLPPMTLRPESIFDAIAGVFGYRDIDFEDYPEFSKQFMLKSPSDELARALFDGDLISFFLARKDCSLEAHRSRLIYYRRDKVVKPQDLKAFLADGLELCNLFVARMPLLQKSKP